jgi:hypothetical protein
VILCNLIADEIDLAYRLGHPTKVLLSPDALVLIRREVGSMYSVVPPRVAQFCGLPVVISEDISLARVEYE